MPPEGAEAGRCGVGDVCIYTLGGRWMVSRCRVLLGSCCSRVLVSVREIQEMAGHLLFIRDLVGVL